MSANPRTRSLSPLATVVAAILALTLAPTVAGAETNSTEDRDWCYVDRGYEVFLGRDATANELSFWASAFDKGTPRSALGQNRANQDEWLEAEVTGLYEGALDRDPDQGGLDHWSNQLADGVRVNRVASAIYGSAEFYSNAGATDTAFVSELYERILARTATNSEIGYWVTEIANRGRDGVAASFFDSLESRNSRVKELFATILDRSPDPGGLSYWSNKLLTANDIELASSLASSREFYAIAKKRCDGFEALSWAPPALEDPVRVQVDPSGDSISMPKDQDYIAEFPDEPVTGMVSLHGGEDVVVIGGEITLDGDDYQAALKVEDFTGTAHLEGLHLDTRGSEGIAGDAIRLNSDNEGSVAQLQNIMVEEVHGVYKNPDGSQGVHGDILQTWAGPDQVRVDRFTGYTDYQGFFLAPEHFWDDNDSEPWDFRRTDLHMTGDGSKLYVMSDQGGQPGQPRVDEVWGDPGKAPKGDSVAHDDEFGTAGVRTGDPGRNAAPDAGSDYISPGYR